MKNIQTLFLFIFLIPVFCYSQQVIEEIKVVVVDNNGNGLQNILVSGSKIEKSVTKNGGRFTMKPSGSNIFTPGSSFFVSFYSHKTGDKFTKSIVVPSNGRLTIGLNINNTEPEAFIVDPEGDNIVLELHKREELIDKGEEIYKRLAVIAKKLGSKISLVADTNSTALQKHQLKQEIYEMFAKGEKAIIEVSDGNGNIIKRPLDSYLNRLDNFTTAKDGKIVYSQIYMNWEVIKVNVIYKDHPSGEKEAISYEVVIRQYFYGMNGDIRAYEDVTSKCVGVHEEFFMKKSGKRSRLKLDDVRVVKSEK